MIEFYRLFSSFSSILMTTLERVNLRPFLSLSKLPSDSHKERWRREEKRFKKERSLMWFDKALVGIRSLFIDNKLLFWRVSECCFKSIGEKNRKIKPTSTSYSSFHLKNFLRYRKFFCVNLFQFLFPPFFRRERGEEKVSAEKHNRLQTDKK